MIDEVASKVPKKGGTLRQLRERAGFSRKSLGQKLDVSFRTIEEWENHRSLPRLDRAAALANALGVSIDDVAISVGIDVHYTPEHGLDTSDEDGKQPGLPGDEPVPIEEKVQSIAIDESEIPRASTMATLAKGLNVSLKRLYNVYGIDTAGIPDDYPQFEQLAPPEKGG